jgi:hypothetical protein
VYAGRPLKAAQEASLASPNGHWPHSSYQQLNFMKKSLYINTVYYIYKAVYIPPPPLWQYDRPPLWRKEQPFEIAAGLRLLPMEGTDSKVSCQLPLYYFKLVSADF